MSCQQLGNRLTTSLEIGRCEKSVNFQYLFLFMFSFSMCCVPKIFRDFFIIIKEINFASKPMQNGYTRECFPSLPFIRLQQFLIFIEMLFTVYSVVEVRSLFSFYFIWLWLIVRLFRTWRTWRGNDFPSRSFLRCISEDEPNETWWRMLFRIETSMSTLVLFRE